MTFKEQGKVNGAVMGVAVALLCLGGATLAADETIAGSVPVISSEPVMPPPPDSEATVAAEYARAKENGTYEAYQLFIERHPNHPLADQARRALSELQESSGNLDR